LRRHREAEVILGIAFGLGIVAGLRTFTPLAAVFLMRGGIWGIVFSIAAVGEYVLNTL
jgi:hypothetical protein